MASISGTSDLTSYVAQLVDLERQSGPEKNLKQDQQDLTLRSATLTDLRTNLTTLNTQAQALTQPGSLSPFATKTVDSSDTSIVTATASATAMTGTHSLLVTQLAKRSTIVSSQLAQAGTDLATAVGTGGKTFRITVNGTATDVSVSVGAGDDNQTILNKMAAAINSTNATVTASVVKDSDSTARLVLTSDSTGSANAITLADVDGTLLASTGTKSTVQASGTTGGAMFANSQLDAAFILDGLSITRGSNSVSDVLSGVTLTLTATQASGATPVTLTVGPDESTIKSKVQAFLDSYNTTINFLKDRTSVTVTTSTDSSGSNAYTVNRGTLASEATYLGLMMNLRSDVGGSITTGSSGGPKSLSEIGITAGADGTLSISDADKFNKALSDSPDGVTALFNSSDGIASRVTSRLSGFVATGGIVDNGLSSISSQLTSINTAIQQQEDYLKVRQDTLLQQYTSLQEAMLQLQDQQTMIDAWDSTTLS